MPISDSDSYPFEAEVRLGRTVSLEQAAQLLNVSRRTIYNRIRDRRLIAVRTLGKSQRVLVRSLYDEGFRPQAFSATPSAVSLDVHHHSINRFPG